MQYIKKIIRNNIFRLCLLLVVSIVVLLLNVTKTLYVGKYIDFLTNELNVVNLYKFVGILFILGILSILFNFVNAYYTAKIQTDITFKVNFDVLDHVKHLPLIFFSDKDSFYINQRINADSNVIVSFLISSFIKITTLIFSFIVLFTILLKLNVHITIIAVITIPVYLTLYNIFKKLLYNRTLEFKEVQNRLFSFMGKQISNIFFIKINSLYELLNLKLLSVYPAFFSSVKKYLKSSILFSSTSSIIENIFNIFLYVFTGIEVLNNRMTIGEFIIIKGYYSMVMTSLGEFAGILKQFPDAMVAHHRLLEILNFFKEPDGTRMLNKISIISGDNISLLLQDKQIIQNFSFQFIKGKIYLISGKNGVGKSSLIKCILGLYRKEMKGEIKYNDNNINEIDLYNIRKKIISVVDQDAEFFFDSVIENISYNNNNINYKKVEEYMLKFGLQIGYKETQNNVRHLSGGEKQKISIIRALLKDPEVLILDEPTSALDTYSVDKLIEEINEQKMNRITIVISHDERFINIADVNVNL